MKGAYAAAIGTILGACILLGRIAIGDWLTALIGVVSLAILFRWKVNNPLLDRRDRGDRSRRVPAAAADLGHAQVAPGRGGKRFAACPLQITPPSACRGFP